jgi:hypothetical protein
MGDRVKPLGLTDDLFVLKANQIESLDDAQSNLVDGALGGTYAPTSEMRIEGAGFGSDDLTDTVISGAFQRNQQGRWGKRVDTSTIVNGDGVTPQVLDMSSDVYVMTATQNQDIIIHLSNTTGQTPAAGDVIEVVRHGIPSPAKSFFIYAEAFPAVRIGSFLSILVAQGNEMFSARYVFGGTTWRPVRMSADTLI